MADITEGKPHIGVVVVGHVDAGKCQGVDTPILMADGSIKMIQNIVPGDKLMGDNSQPRTVVNVTSGNGPMYQITPTKGDFYTANDKHILSLKVSNYEMVNWDNIRKRYRIRWIQGSNIKEKSFPVSNYDSKENAKASASAYLYDEVPHLDGYRKYGDVVDVSVRDYMALPKRVQDVFKGYSIGVDFPEQNVPINPYALGMWLGDGTSAATEITTADDEIVDFFTEYCETIGLQFNPKGTQQYQYFITTGTNNGRTGRNVFRNFLTEYNLFGNKHIPDIYKFNTREVRLQVLAGLIDSDGYNSNNTYDFCFKSEQLTDDTIYLARSLGYRVVKKEVTRICTNAPGGPKKGQYYRFFICGNTLDEIPCLLERKKTHERQSSKDACVTGIKIDPIGDDNYYGFELDGNGRYLMGDFTVTHNSTTTGHLLFKLGQINDREREKMKELASSMGKESFSFAFFLDKQQTERERGITIACTSKEFFTPTKHYTVIDAPGHRDFINNMVTGAAAAEVAILMIPAELGGFEKAVAKGDRSKNEVEGQTRQHARLINLLGIKQVIVCVNKMDDKSVNYSEERFNEIKDEACRMLAQAGYGMGKFDNVLKSVPFIPISGLKGFNLFEKSEEMPWYKGFNVVNKLNGKDVETSGHTLTNALDDFVQVPIRDTTGDLRMPVSEVLKIPGVGDIVTGRIEKGTLKKGDKVVFCPSNITGDVFSIEMHHRTQNTAVAGDNVGINSKRMERKPKKGDVMMLVSEKPDAVYEFTAQINVQDHPGELKCSVDGKGGFAPDVKVRTAHAACQMYHINWKMGKSTNKQKVDDPPFIQQGDMCEVVFRPKKPIYMEPFSQTEGLGRIAIMDSNSLVALGKVTKVTYATPEIKAKAAEERKAAAALKVAKPKKGKK